MYPQHNDQNSEISVITLAPQNIQFLHLDLSVILIISLIGKNPFHNQCVFGCCLLVWDNCVVLLWLPRPWTIRGQFLCRMLLLVLLRLWVQEQLSSFGACSFLCSGSPCHVSSLHGLAPHRIWAPQQCGLLPFPMKCFPFPAHLSKLLRKGKPRLNTT